MKCLTEGNETPQKYLFKEVIKLKTLTINSPYSYHSGEKPFRKSYDFQNYMFPNQISNSTYNSIMIGKSNISDPLVPRRSLSLKRKASEGSPERIKSKEGEFSSLKAMPMLLSSKQKSQISPFLLQENKRPSLPSYGSVVLAPRSSSAEYCKRRPSKKEICINQNPLFSKASVNKSETPMEKMKLIKSFGQSHKTLSFQPPFLEIKGPQIRFSLRANKKEYHSNLSQTNFHNLSEDRNNSRVTEQDRIIKKKPAKKHKNIMVCVDASDSRSSLNHCFIQRKIATNPDTKKTDAEINNGLEDKIQLLEIQKKLHLGKAYKFLYLLNGRRVAGVSDIPLEENIIILSKKSKFEPKINLIQDQPRLSGINKNLKDLKTNERKGKPRRDDSLDAFHFDNSLNSDLSQIIIYTDESHY